MNKIEENCNNCLECNILLKLKTEPLNNLVMQHFRVVILKSDILTIMKIPHPIECTPNINNEN